MKIYRPTTPGRRGMTGVEYRGVITAPKPFKALVRGKKQKGGRSRSGRITVRFRGGGAKRKFRLVDFRQDKFDIPGIVESIEYDPNRTAFIALVKYQDGERRYILAPEGLKPGMSIISAEKTPFEPGNRMKLKNIPIGSQVYNVELQPGYKGQIIRSAGSSARVLAQEGKFTHLELPSGEIRKVFSEGYASLGVVSNPEWSSVIIGKAGRMRHLGRRPHVRGTAMNPRDHPHGGGEGRAPIGLKHPKTPWGKPALGVKTRKKSKPSDKFIIQRRKK